MKDKIKNTPIADKKSELEALAKVPKNQQAKVVEKVLSGKAGNLATRPERTRAADFAVAGGKRRDGPALCGDR